MKLHARVGMKGVHTFATSPSGLVLSKDADTGLRTMLIGVLHGERVTVKATSPAGKPYLLIFLVDERAPTKKFWYWPAPPFWIEGNIRVVERVMSPRNALKRWAKL